MASCTILCSERDCRARVQEAKGLSFDALSKLLDRCNGCGDWLLKSNSVATQTTNSIGALYAARYNERALKQ
jgi:hypothetical protein